MLKRAEPVIFFECDRQQLLDHTISSLQHVVPHTVECVGSIMDHLQAQKLVLNQKQFGELERNLGFNWVPRGVLAQRSKLNVTQFDWCHCYLVQGLFGLEAFRPVESGIHHHVMSCRIMVSRQFIEGHELKRSLGHLLRHMRDWTEVPPERLWVAHLVHLA